MAIQRNERFLNRAIGVALTSTCQWKHGALIAKGSKPLVWGPNIFRNNSSLNYSGATFHAEDVVLRQLCRLTGTTYYQGNFSDCTLYVARVNNQGIPRLSRPCQSCWKLLYTQGITEVVYTTGAETMSREVVL